jgi:hypothetical protein
MGSESTLTDMLRSLAIVLLLGLAGLVAGVAYAATDLGPRSYTATEEFTLPAPSRDANRLAAVARSQHVQGVRVRVLDGHTLQVTGHGSLTGSVTALQAVVSQVRKAIKDMSLTHVRSIHGGVHALARRPQGNALQTGGIGLLAGLGAGLGLVVPLRRRMSAIRT